MPGRAATAESEWNVRSPEAIGHSAAELSAACDEAVNACRKREKKSRFVAKRERVNGFPFAIAWAKVCSKVVTASRQLERARNAKSLS
jgi:hypothetical protein